MSNTPDSANNPRSEMLGNAPVTSLMIKFAVPSIIAMLVGALYNIVDQLFIGQAVGQLGNAATNIAFPFSTSCLSLALLFGIGGASCFNLSMGAGRPRTRSVFRRKRRAYDADMRRCADGGHASVPDAAAEAVRLAGRGAPAGARSM